MLKKCTKVLFLILLAVFLLPTIFGIGGYCYDVVSADSTVSGSVGGSTTTTVDDTVRRAGYVIEDYHMQIKVNENNVLNIVEYIDCKFTMSSHGILRYIPIVNNLTRKDGSKDIQLAKISNVIISDQYTETVEDGMVTFKIGDPHKSIIGYKSYTISYNYDLGEDKSTDFDELYFNIVGNKWDTKIKHLSFEIEMPKEFDGSKIGFSKGSIGTSGYEGVSWKLYDDFTIAGEVSEGLPAGHALTIRIELPENYFVGENSHTSGYWILSFLIPSVALLLGFVIYFIYKSRNRYVQTVEFYPPKGCSSLDAALIYKGRANNQDVVSLLVQLASHGYIKIKESKGEIDRIIVLKNDYIGDNALEADFLRVISGYGNSVSFDTLRGEKFPLKVSQIKDKANDRKNKGKYIKGSFANGLLFICSLLALLPPMFVGVGEFVDSSNIMLALMLSGMLIGLTFCMREIKEAYPFVFGLSVFVIVLTAATCSQISLLGKNCVIGVLYGIGIFIILQIISGKKVVDRTEKGLKLYGEILGFRKFIKTAEKDRLEMLCEENPEYFYDILPYAYVLGVTDVWIKKFEGISVPPAEWYESTSGRIFTVHDSRKLLSTASKASSPITTSSSGGGGGGFSGGGFSGGGSGGGGGGRW